MFETGDLDLDFQGQICHESSNVCVIPCHKLVNVINIEPLLCRPPRRVGVDILLFYRCQRPRPRHTN